MRHKREHLGAAEFFQRLRTALEQAELFAGSKGKHIFFSGSADAHRLDGGSVATDDLDIALGHAQRVSEERTDGSVGSASHRRSGDRDLETFAVQWANPSL